MLSTSLCPQDPQETMSLGRGRQEGAQAASPASRLRGAPVLPSRW